MPDENNELTLDSVDSFDPEGLSEQQKDFLEEHKTELSNEQKEKFGIAEGGGEDDKGKGADDLDFKDDGSSPPEPENKSKKSKDDEGEDGDEDNEVDPNDVKFIEKKAAEVANKVISPILDQQEKGRVQSEMAQALVAYPELKPLEQKILRFASHPTYRGRPINEAIVGAAGVDVFMKIGAKRAKVADEEASKTKGNSTGARDSEIKPASVNNSGIPSFVGKSESEINQIMSKARQEGKL